MEASGSIIISGVIDGISITSANVLYALQSTANYNNGQTPGDTAFTYDNFPPLNAGYYVWQATKITDSDGKISITGKMCLGPTTDFLSGTEVYAVSASNSQTPTSWATTYNKEKGKYLWTATRVQYTNGSYGYLNPKCVGYWGEDGTSPYFADIDNEMVSVACDYQGNTTAAFDKTVNVGMWHGSAAQALTALSTTSHTNFTITPSQSGKTVRVQIAKGVQIAQVTDITITIACENSGNKTLHLYVNGVRPGSPGEKAVLYDLIPSASAVKCDKSNTLTPSSLTCDVQRSEGSSVSRATSSHGTLRYRKNGDITSASDGTALAINTGSVSLASTDTYVTFAFFDTNGTLRDKERVPVTKDGNDGNNAADVQPNILLRTIFDKTIDFVLEAWTRTNSYINIDGATDTIVNGRKSIRLNASSLSSAIDFQQDVYGRIKTSTWYTLSFNYFATQAFRTFLWDGNNSHGIVDTSAGYYLDGVFYNSSLGIDGNHQWPADWTGARHSITFKTKSSFGTTNANVLFRCPAGGQVAICMPKLEEGKVATAYMAHEDDLKGANGATGRMYYLAGEYTSKEYKRTSVLCPVVCVITNGTTATYWYLDADTNNVGTSSSPVYRSPSDSGQSVWKQLQDFGAVLTDAIFVKEFAQFGAAIITKDWLISVHGTINGINYGGDVMNPEMYNNRPAYTYFDPAYPQGFGSFLLGVKVDEVNTATWTKVTDDFALAAGTYTIQIVCDVYSEDSMSLRLYNEDTLQNEIATITSEESVTIGKTLTLSSSSKWNIRAAMGEDGDTGNIHSITIVPEDARFVPNYALDLKTGRTYQNGAFTSVGPNSKIVIENGIIKFYGKWSFPNIVMGVGADGGAVLDFYGADGRWLYGFGPSNEHSVQTQAESMTFVYYDINQGSSYITDGGTTDAVIVMIYRYCFKGTSIDYSRRLFKYLARIHGTIYGGEHVGGDDTLARQMNEKIIKYGYHNPLQSSDKYGDGIVLTAGNPQSGIITRLPHLLNSTTAQELDYRGFYPMQDSNFNRSYSYSVYRYYTNDDPYNPQEAFYFDVSSGSTGSVGYNSPYSGWMYLNLCVDPRDSLEDTLIDPIYWFKLEYINENGKWIKNEILYINKSKLNTILQNAGYSL